MDNKKCILFVRVSTEVQNFDEQERELYDMACRDGYKRENIIAIAEKESGRKLTEEERKGLTTLKDYIEKDESINCVYLWEISRLARRQKVLMSIREYLIERKINIKIKNPPCTLLKPDGSIDEGADLVFSLYSQMSESEMRTKIERFKRSKKINSEKMKYSGGKIMYGYKINADGYYEVDEEKAKMIREIYDIYTTQNIGMHKLLQEINSRGYELKGYMLNKILSNTAYIGYVDYPKLLKDEKKGNYRKYPPIISEETFKLAQKRKIENKTYTDKSRNNIWLCAKLIKCTECGRFLMANKGARIYSCKAHTHINFYKKNCGNKTSINISAIDGIVWHYSKSLYAQEKIEDKEKHLELYKLQINNLKEKIDASPKIIDDFKRREERLYDIYVDSYSTMTKEKYHKEIKKIFNEKKEYESKITEYKSDILRINNAISALEEEIKKKKKSIASELMLRLTIQNQPISKSEKYNIVHRYIKYIEIQEVILYYHQKEYNEYEILKERISSSDIPKKVKEVKIYGIDDKEKIYYFFYTEKTIFKKFATCTIYEKTNTYKISHTIIIRE